jgi:hypothetical protein
MKGDFSRLTFNPRKRYSGVLMQQGRVQTDADWNEQLEIQHHRAETEARDVIGLCGVPKESGGFAVQPLDSVPAGVIDLAISAGRIYVDGLLCELAATPVVLSDIQAQQATVESLDADGRSLAAGQWVEISGDDEQTTTHLITHVDADLGVLTFDANLPPYQDSEHPFLRRTTTYLTQPDQPAPQFETPPAPDAPVQLPSLNLPTGNYLAYLHVWEQHVTALDDPLIREQALGGPDTTTRIKNVWQVGLLSFDNSGNDTIDCQTALPEWDALTAAPTGLLNARTQPVDDPKDPCLLPPEAGYRRLENQLYRVEIQQGGARDVATFKWSRENGSIQTTVEDIKGSIVTVADLGRDEVLGFSNGEWVEIVDDESELNAAPRPLALITGLDSASREITLDTDVSALKGKPGLKLRRWEQTGADGVLMTAAWLDLEGGIQVQFSEGTYRPGDYWLIPARTATAEIEWPPFASPNTTPTPQPPRGLKHRYCRLALLYAGDSLSVSEDCRALFPPLTHICAEDVCFDNTDCQLPNVETVQDAIEQLCQEHDLRHHNKHLHGWGIVCGLQVNCGPDEIGDPCRHVTVRSGYALDCEGNDIIHEQDESFDLIEMIEEYNAQHPDGPLLNGDGEVCLVLNGDLNTPYSLEKYDPAWNSWPSLFKHTLWSDFLDDCLGNLLEFLKSELSDQGGQSNQLISPTQKRLTTLLNLLIQLFNQTNGQYVYLSGEQGLEDERTEHTILRNLYVGLRALLQSHTFCGMFDDTAFPEYPYKGLNSPTTAPPYIPTLFGKGYHRRLRVHPSGRMAYTVGLGNTINVYDLGANELIAELKFPDDAASVQDVAFPADGQQLYAVATINGKDSLFAVAEINSTAHKWLTSTVVCDVQLVTLATRAKSPGKVYAAGKGKGIYELTVANIQPNIAPTFAFNASGHLVVVEQGTEAYAFATAHGQGTPAVYDRVLRYDLNNQQTTQTFHLVVNGQNVTGADDIAVAYDAQPPRLYVVTNPPSNSNHKHLLIFDARGESAGSVSSLDLEEMTAIHPAYNPVTHHLMLTYADSYRVRLVSPNNTLAAGFRQPVQIAPSSIAVAPDISVQGQQRVYVLNSISNTITSIPATQFDPSKQVPLSPLVKYRAEVLEAFVRLFGGLLQYLKDCLCDHLLVNCPQCEPEDKLYLACVQIKDGHVYKICNFSKRKYVKSFPTVEYWLSAIPVIPLVGKAVESLCCAILPEFFGAYKASTSNQSPNKFKSAGMYMAASALHTTNFGALLGKNFGALERMGGQLLRDLLACAAHDLEQAPALAREDFIGARLEDAWRMLHGNGVTVVGVDNYDPCNTLSNIAQMFHTPTRLARGARIRLTVEDEIVRSYTPLPKTTGTYTWTGSPAGVDVRVQGSATGAQETAADTLMMAAGASADHDVQSLRDELTSLREEFDRAQQKHADALASRDVTIASLETNTRTLQENLKILDELQQQVKALSSRPARKSRKEEKPPPAK